MKANESQLRDNTGRELTVYDMNTGRMKFYNLFGNGYWDGLKLTGIQPGLRIRGPRTPGTGVIQEQIKGITLF